MAVGSSEDLVARCAGRLARSMALCKFGMMILPVRMRVQVGCFDVSSIENIWARVDA